MTISAPGHIALEVVIILTSFSFLCLRLYLNIRTPGGRVKALVISDWLLISAAAIGVLLLVYQIWKNIMLMESDDPFLIVSKGQLKSVLAAATIYTAILWLIKASFIAFYWSLHAHLTTAVKRLLYFSMVYLSASFIVMNLLNFLRCRPIESMFDFNRKDFCHIGVDFTTGTAFFVLNVSSDLLVMAIGLLFVYNLRMSLGPRQIVATAFVFLVGSIPVIASTVRYATIYFIIREPLSAFDRFPDIEAWSEIDCAFATYAACLPALRSLIRKKRDRALGYGGSASGGGSRTVRSGTVNTENSRKRGQREGGGNVIWLSSGQQAPDNIDDDVDVDSGDWGSGVFTTPLSKAPGRGCRSNSALDIYVTRDFDISIDRSSKPLPPLPSPPATARIVTGVAGPAEYSYQNFSTATAFYSQSQSLSLPKEEQHQKILDQEEDSTAGSDVELRDLGSPPGRDGTPNTLSPER